MRKLRQKKVTAFPESSKKHTVEPIFQVDSVSFQRWIRISLAALPHLASDKGILGRLGKTLHVQTASALCQAWGDSLHGRQRCITQAEVPNVPWRPPTCLQGAVKQWNSICSSDLRRAIFSKKVGQGLQQCCLRTELPPLSPGGCSIQWFLTQQCAGEEGRPDLLTWL